MTNETLDAIYDMRDRINTLFAEDDRHIGAGMRLILRLVEHENLFDCQVLRILCPLGELLDRIDADERAFAEMDKWCDEQEAKHLAEHGAA